MREGKPFFHFSVDDVFDALVDVADRGIPLFDHAFFGFLKSLHEEFGIGVDAYVFLEGDRAGLRRGLDELPDRLGTEFASAPWLRLGPHALSRAVRPYAQDRASLTDTFTRLYEQIDRLVGPAGRSRLLRLHYFSECYEFAPFLAEHGVESLLLTDKPAIAYRLDETTRAELSASGVVRHAGLDLRRSHTRLERMADEGWDDEKILAGLRRALADHGYVALFTHEIEIARPEVRDLTRRCLALLQAMSVPSI